MKIFTKMKTTLSLLLFISTVTNAQVFNTKTSIGSIKQGDSCIMLKKALGLKAGDVVGIETGGEKGGGKRGTEGVNGSYPYKMYETLALMQADKSQVDQMMAWNKEGGLIYRYNADVKTWHPSAQWGIDKSLPLSLAAKVLRVVDGGLSVYIDKKAVVTTVNAFVFSDNSDVIIKVIADGIYKAMQSGKVETIDFAKFGVKKGDTLNIAKPVRITHSGYIDPRNISVLFNGVTVRSPKGFTSAIVAFENGNGLLNIHLDGLKIIANGNYEGLGIDLGYAPKTNENFMNPWVYLAALGMYGGGIKATNIEVTDAPSYAIQFGSGVVDGFLIKYTKGGLNDYTGWPLHNLGGVGGVARNGKFYSPVLMRALEIQQATNCTFENMEIINGIMAQNQGVNNQYKNIIFRLQGGSAEADKKILRASVIIVNQLLAGTNQSGALFENINIIEEGYLTKDNELMRGFIFAEQTRNITMKNCSYARPKVFTPYGYGNGYGAAIQSQADNLTIDGFVAKGAFGAAYGCEQGRDNALIELRGKGNVIKNLTAQVVVMQKDAVRENIKTICLVREYEALK
jgi:hypothetical protein